MNKKLFLWLCLNDGDSTCSVCTSWCVRCTVLAGRRTEDGSWTGSRWKKCGSCVMLISRVFCEIIRILNIQLLEIVLTSSWYWQDSLSVSAREVLQTGCARTWSSSRCFLLFHCKVHTKFPVLIGWILAYTKTFCRIYLLYSAVCETA